MEEKEYKKMYDLETRYWWYVGRRRIIDNIIGKFTGGRKYKKIIDFGCGTGMNVDFLRKYGEEIIGIDNSRMAVNYAKSRGYSDVVLVNNDVTRLSFADDTIGMITLLDVLEHLSDDDKVIKELYRVLEYNGLLVMTVPAYQFLWSEHDIALHHYRRYTTGRIKKVLEKNGFEIIKLSYCISFIFPLILIYRILRGLLNKVLKSKTPKTSQVIVPKIINGFFIFLLNIEEWLLRYVNLPFGTSVIVVAKKRDQRTL